MPAPVSGSVLIGDDDAALLRFATKYLTRLGYTVVACRNTAEAWSQFEQRPAWFSLALIDVTMKEQPGEQLALRMLAAQSELRVLLWSGYPFNLEQCQARSPGRVGFLHKPFTPAMLVDAVQQLLASTA